MASDEPQNGDGPARRGLFQRGSRTRWLGPILLAVALVLLIPLARHLPTARSVRLDVTDPGTLTGLELTWLEGDEALRSTVLRFGARQAPAHIDTAIRVTDGTYRLQLRIERTGGVTHVERRVSFAPDVSLVVVPVP